MSKKAKYKAVLVYPHIPISGYNVESPSGKTIAKFCSSYDARRIARALNAMEDKPKAKAWKFDWSGIDPKYKWAAMDDDYWWIYQSEPHIAIDDSCWFSLKGDYTYAEGPQQPYPGDWRDSLQERP